MQLQRVFKTPYVDYLRKHIDVAKYKSESFDYDCSMVNVLANVYKPDGLCDKMIANLDNEYEQAILLYEAFPNLSPLVASQPNLWTYLTHVDLFDFCKKRWPDIDMGVKKEQRTENEKIDYIEDHWFRSPNGIMRTTLMNLWWSVYCSIDEEADAEHKYDYTKILFERQDFRTRRFGGSTLFRHREAVIGILKFIRDYKEIMDVYFEGRAIYIAKYFNHLGGTKQLAYMKRDFFYNELVSHLSDIEKINTREDILNQ